MSQAIQHIAIMGSGIELKMTAAILSVALKPFGLKITVLELPAKHVCPLVETTGPEFSALCQILGLVERDVLVQCQATFRLGTRYISANNDWFVPFAHIGLKAQQDDFEQGLFQTLRQQNNNNLNAWSAAATAAMAGKFAIAGKDRTDLQQALTYGVHLNVAAYGTILGTLCSKQNIHWLKLTDEAITVKADELGNISSVISGEHQVMADFWFDLRAEQSKQQWQSWKNDLPLTWHAQWQIPSADRLVPYTQLQQLRGGWLKTSPLRNVTVVEVFAQQEECALPDLEQQVLELSMTSNHAIVWTPIKCQVLNAPWQGNCLYLGEAAINLGGLVFSNLQCVQTALVHFIDLFPDLPVGEHNRRQFNLIWQRFVQDARDYSAVHFLPGVKPLTDIAVNAAETLSQRLQLFARLGRLTPMESDAVSEGQWHNLLYGLGLRPQLNSVVLSSMSEQQLHTATQQVAQSITALVAGMPDHEQYLARFYPLVKQP